MLAGLSVAIALLAPADAARPAYGPPAPIPAAVKTPAKAAIADACPNRRPSADSREIVICAQRPQGYRLNPDVLEARREKRHNGGRPRPPENFNHNDCATVGPMGCRGGPTINLIAAAMTAATMAKRLAKGEEIGSMFETTPEPTEYQLYLEAKRRREAREAQAAQAAAVAKMKAAAQGQESSRPPADR